MQEKMKLRKSKDSDLVLIGNSKIHGKGVFAAERILKDTEIIEYTGEKISKKEGDKRSNQQLEQGKLYVFELNKKYDVDGLSNGSDAHLINHSCDPNCESINFDNSHIWIVAIKDIPKGAEITYDYELTGDKEITCKCGTKKCQQKL